MLAPNPVASLEQLECTPSSEDGFSPDLEEDLRNFGCELIQTAGILLRLPQVVMATAQVLLQRFYYMASLKKYGIVEIGMGALFLASKVEESFVHIPSVLAVYDRLIRQTRNEPTDPPLDGFSQQSFNLKHMLIRGEMEILKHLGFHVHTELPYGLMINYLRILDLEQDGDVAGRAWNYLNDGLRTTVYATHPPSTIACAAIFLACRDKDIRLPNNWWLLFDTEQEDYMHAAGHIRRLYYRKLDRAKLPLYTS